MLAAGRTIRPTERVGTEGAREETRRAAIERESATHVREARARFLVDSIAIPSSVPRRCSARRPCIPKVRLSPPSLPSSSSHSATRDHLRIPNHGSLHSQGVQAGL